MSNRIRLPDHYMTNDIGAMSTDEIAHVPSHVVGVDYITRSLHLDSRFLLNPQDHGDLDLEDEYNSRQKVNTYISVMSLYALHDHIYVADLRNLDSSQLAWGEYDEVAEDSDLSLHPYNNVEANDYNHWVANNHYYRPLAAAAIYGLNDEVEFLGEGTVLDAAKYLYEESDKRKLAFEQYMAEQEAEAQAWVYDKKEEEESDRDHETQRIAYESSLEDK